MDYLTRLESKILRKKGTLPGVEDLTRHNCKAMELDLGIKVPDGALQRFAMERRAGIAAGDSLGDLTLVRRKLALLSSLRWYRKGRVRSYRLMPPNSEMWYTGRLNDLLSEVAFRKERGTLNWTWLRQACRVFSSPPAYGALKSLWGGLGGHVLQELTGGERRDFVERVLSYAQTTRALAACLPPGIPYKIVESYLLGELFEDVATGTALPAGLQQFLSMHMQRFFLDSLHNQLRSAVLARRIQELAEDVAEAVVLQLWTGVPGFMLN